MLFTKAEIEEGLLALVDELVASGVTSAIYVVGGAAIMLHVEREALTNDVDVLYSSAEIRASVRSVGVAKRWRRLGSTMQRRCGPATTTETTTGRSGSLVGTSPFELLSRCSC